MGSGAQSIFAGDIFSTNSYGDIVILEYINCNNITVKFLNTGAIRKTNSAQVKNGILKDETVRLYGIKVGDEFQTNSCGKCVVVEYKNAKKILVKFLDTEELKWTNSSQLTAGTASSRGEIRRISVGDAVANKYGDVAVVINALPASRYEVQFNDGEIKNVGIAVLRSGGFIKGSWNYSREDAINIMSKTYPEYDYSLFEFKGVKVKSKVVCKHHGVFEISFDNHINGKSPSGCRKCAHEKRAAERTLNSSVFVEQAKAAGQVGYTYNLTTYKNRHTKISILCNGCGNTFMQSPEKHLTGQGCPFCKKAGFVTTKEGTFYVLENNQVTKVGITNRNAQSRAKDINRTTDDKFHVVAQYRMDGATCLRLENEALRMLREEYSNPETKFDGYTECFIGLRSDNIVEMLDCLMGV